jgi:putative NADPH-quinone reductase
MRTLIVFCHPCPDSYNATLFATARDALASAGHEVRCVDLYAQGFDPVLTPQEKRDYLPNTQAVIANVKNDVEQIRWAQHLVFVFPTWFYGPPAMLKGWFERTWLPGVAFTVPDKPGGKAGPGMQHVTRLTVVTTSGSPWWWLRLIRDPCRNFFKRGLRALFHPRCTTTYLQLHGMNTSTYAQREAFVNKVKRTLVSIAA